MSNLQVPLEIAHTRGWLEPGFWDWAQIKGLDGINNSSSGFFPTDTWWWWRATRVIDTLIAGQSIDYTITEFPLFSFILGDLHPHVLSLPFLVLFLSLMSNMYLSSFDFNKNWIRQNPVEYGVIALILGSIAKGETTIEGFLHSEDPLSTADCLRKLGLNIPEIKKRPHSQQTTQ